MKTKIFYVIYEEYDNVTNKSIISTGIIQAEEKPQGKTEFSKNYKTEKYTDYYDTITAARKSLKSRSGMIIHKGF